MPPAKRAPAKKRAKTAARSGRAKPRPKARARRAGGWRTQLPLLEQHHIDLIGLALVATGIFLVFPLWMGWDGGRGGGAIVDGLRYIVGVLAYGAPIGLCATGALCVLRPVLPAVRPFRAGAICLIAAFTLALAAGTLGLGPSGARHGFWHTDFLSARGGIIGDALFYAASNLIGTVGAHILAVFLFLAALLLLTGASVAGVVKATAAVTADTTRALRRT
jgi:DNA segregation ATPase FtsK/SpoIIIE, S-DNA-T family